MQENRTDNKVMWPGKCLRKAVLALICSVVLFGCGHPQFISSKQAIKDVDFLIEQLKDKHPEPFEQISEADFFSEVKQLKTNLPEQVKVRDFSLSIAALLAQIEDSHTMHKNFSWFQQHKYKGGKVFPIRFRYKNGHMKVAAWSPDVEPGKLKKGDVVLSVNGESMKSILARYGSYVSTETDEQRRRAVDSLFAQYHFMAGDTCDHYRLTLRNSNGRRYEATLAAVRPWLYLYDKAQPSWPLFYHQFYHGGKICLFKAQSFSNKFYNKIKKKTDAIIAEMKERGTETLVFDLRGNGGGNADLGTQLLRKTIDKEYGEYKPHPKAWHGKLVLLCDLWTGSAASWLAAVVKDYEIGIIAGEETGGRASFYGNIEHVNLPHSGLSCVIATRYFPRPAGYNDRRGVLPDLPVDVTANDEMIIDKIADYLSSGENAAL